MASSRPRRIQKGSRPAIATEPSTARGTSVVASMQHRWSVPLLLLLTARCGASLPFRAPGHVLAAPLRLSADVTKPTMDPDEYSRRAHTICNASYKLRDDQLDEWAALYVKATVLVTNASSDGGGKAGCEADPSSYNTTACVPGASGLDIAPTGLGLKWDAYYCGTSKADWTNLTGQSDKPMNDLCNAPLHKDQYTYRADGSILTCFGRTNQQVLEAYCSNWVDDDPTEPDYVKALNNNVPSMDCFTGGANCDMLYCQTCSDLCP